MTLNFYKNPRSKRYAKKLAFILARMIKDPSVQEVPAEMLAEAMAKQIKAELDTFAEEIRHEAIKEKA